ncbi:MAG TPA: hypothetical protein VFH54_15255 [Mycobacteriales bacterium]|nr:hypothetical protein [Mycobacteriales bacterium]
MILVVVILVRPLLVSLVGGMLRSGGKLNIKGPGFQMALALTAESALRELESSVAVEATQNHEQVEAMPLGYSRMERVVSSWLSLKAKVGDLALKHGAPDSQDVVASAEFLAFRGIVDQGVNTAVGTLSRLVESIQDAGEEALSQESTRQVLQLVEAITIRLPA